MKKFNIYEGSNEIPAYSSEIKAGDMLNKIFATCVDIDANIVASFDTIDDARSALSEYAEKSYTKEFINSGRKYISTHGFWIEEDVYETDVEGESELIESGDIWDTAFDPYVPKS